MSSIPYLIIAMRSIPNPKANPCHRGYSIPTLAKTFGFINPQPPISIHPELLHILQPLPLQMGHVQSTSAEGSVNGKKLGRNRVFKLLPKNSFTKKLIVPFKS